jgi:hypothetical protein
MTEQGAPDFDSVYPAENRDLTAQIVDLRTAVGKPARPQRECHRNCVGMSVAVVAI